MLITPIHNYCKTDYFKYNDTVYVNSHYSWFEYDDDSYDYNEISRSAVPQEVLDNKSLYGFDYSDLVWDSSIIKFEIAAIMKTIMRAQAARAVIMTAIMIGIPVIAGIQVAVTGTVTGDYCIT